MEHDKELESINDILASLAELDDSARARVIKYVLERLSISGNDLPGQTILNVPRLKTDEQKLPMESVSGIIDIRTLKEQKQPRSAIQMVVLVAYYLQEIAPIVERKEAIDTGDVAKYFKQAQYKLPAGKNGAADTLNNAKNAGYLETAGRGAFRLNPVGYNLVVHGLSEKTSIIHAKKKTTKKVGSKSDKRG